MTKHLCAVPNRRCVAPAHVIRAKSAEAKEEKNLGIRRMGEASGGARITSELAQKIIQSFGNGKSAEIRGKEFGVSEGTVGYIDRGQTWTHLMTEEEKKLRANVQKKRKKMSNAIKPITREMAREIKRAKLTSALAKDVAEEHGIAVERVEKIWGGRSYKNVLPDSDDDESLMILEQIDKDEAGFKDGVKRISDNSEFFTDEKAITHLLYEGNPTMTDARIPTLCYFGKNSKANVVSYLAHRRMKRMPKGMMCCHNWADINGTWRPDVSRWVMQKRIVRTK